MLLQLGSRTAAIDVNGLLLDCHTRIRKFLAIARQVARTPEAPHAERRDAAGQVHRYFTQAFPLHLADEDELLARHLAGRDQKTDAALDRMRADHVDHAADVSLLVVACDSVVRETERVEANDARLLAAAETLTGLLEPHLALEERELFPVLATLPPAVKDEIRSGMRARRERP